MDFMRRNWWLILLFIGAFGFMTYSTIIDSKTQSLLQKNFRASPTEIKTAMMQAVGQCQDIDKMLKKMMDEIGADRAYVFQFHNGTRLVSGKHFYYYSNTHEVVGPGVSSEITNLQMLPMSLLVPSWLPQLIKGKGFVTETAHEKHEYTKSILEAQGIESIAILPRMEKKNTYPIGFMGVDFTKSQLKEGTLKILYRYTNPIRKMLWS